MRVLMIIPSLKKAGPVNVALNLCQSIMDLDAGIEIDVLSFKSGELESYFKNCCHNVFVMPPFFAIKNLIKNMRNDYDLVHSHCVLPDLVNAVFVRGPKRVSTLHNYITVDYVFEKGFLKGNFISLLHRYALFNIDLVVSCSQSVSSFVFKQFRLKSVFVRNGVVGGRGMASVMNKQRYIIVGVFNKRKNHDVAIKGFVDAKKDDAELIILGDGPCFNEIRSKYTNEKNIAFLGSVNNPRDYISTCDVFLSSSCAEGLPMALIEAMSESLTYILSDIEPHREINNMDTSSGIIVDNSSDDFRNAIVDLASDDLLEMKSKSKKVYESNLTAKKMGISYIDIYKRVFQ